MRSAKPDLSLCDHSERPLDAVGIGHQQPFDGSDLRSRTLVVQAKQDDTTMQGSVAVHFLSEVFVVRDEDSTLFRRKSDDGVILDATRLIVHGERILPLLPEPACYRSPHALIHDEPHQEASARGR